MLTLEVSLNVLLTIVLSPFLRSLHSRNHKYNSFNLQSLNEDSSHGSTDNRQQLLPDAENSGTLEELTEMQETKDTNYLYLRTLTLLFLMLQTKFLIPSSTVQHIMEEFVEVHFTGQSLLCQSLLSKIQHMVDISDGTAKEIISEIKSSDVLDHLGLHTLEKLCTQTCSVMFSH